MFDQVRSRLARMIAPGGKNPRGRTGHRMYAGAESSRLTASWQVANTSADTQLASSLQIMRSRSRALVRDSAFANRARDIVVNNVIGPGVGLQADVMTSRGAMNETLNDAIEEAFCTWSRASTCHTGGELHFADLERACFGSIFETGEAFLRKHRRPFGDGTIPFALELIEPERIADEFMQSRPAEPGNELRMGVEVESKFYRPVAYWIRTRHPGELKFIAPEVDKFERVPAADIIHLRIIDRWPQTRGEPWMHAVLRKLNDIDGYTEAEIVAARSAASYMGFIESDFADNPNEEEQSDGSLQTELSPGIIDKLRPGEKFNFAAPNRPNSQAEGFLRFMLREMAAGAKTSYESLSRDYSQSNYSSSRLALLDDRDTWKTLQLWWLRAFRYELHREWLKAAVLSESIPGIRIAEYALNPEKFECVSFKPRGWSWIDPTKEVQAYKDAVKAGFTTVADVIAQTANGQDLDDILEGRERELGAMKDKGLYFDTSPQVYVPAETRGQIILDAEGNIIPVAGAPADGNAPPAPAAPADTTTEDTPARVFPFRGKA
jgi:lambda family phage portal protein